MVDEHTIEQLCNAIRKTSGIRLRTPKDYDTLSSLIFLETHTNISASTLKRLMGYLPGNRVQPRTTTLDILSRYLGYTDLEDFTASHSSVKTVEALPELSTKLHSLHLQLQNLATQVLNIENSLK